jgi:hypothetical protein
MTKLIDNIIETKNLKVIDVFIPSKDMKNHFLVGLA